MFERGVVLTEEEEENEWVHPYDEPLINNDLRRFTHDVRTPVLLLDLIRTAEIWAVLHPRATRRERVTLVAAVADTVGVKIGIA